jgi:hypothetical protein
VWNELTSAEAINRLIVGFGGFHDACLREISVATETYVGEGMAMSCPSNLDTSVLLFFQRDAGPVSAVEIHCREVTGLHLKPSAEGCDSIIMGGAIGLAQGAVRLAVNFIAGPMRAVPNSRVYIPGRSFEQPDLEVTARSMVWRPLENSLGRVRRYRPQERGEGA